MKTPVAPADQKGLWSERALPRGEGEGEEEDEGQEKGRSRGRLRRRVRDWGDSAWRTMWEGYRSGIPEDKGTPA